MSVTTIAVRDGIDVEALRRVARERFQVAIAGGLGPLAGRVFRIGHLGDMNPAMILGALAGVEAALRVQGVPFRSGDEWGDCQFGGGWDRCGLIAAVDSAAQQLPGYALGLGHRAGIRPGLPSHFLLLAQKKVTKEKSLNTSERSAWLQGSVVETAWTNLGFCVVSVFTECFGARPVQTERHFTNRTLYADVCPNVFSAPLLW